MPWKRVAGYTSLPPIKEVPPATVPPKASLTSISSVKPVVCTSAASSTQCAEMDSITTQLGLKVGGHAERQRIQRDALSLKRKEEDYRELRARVQRVARRWRIHPSDAAELIYAVETTRQLLRL